MIMRERVLCCSIPGTGETEAGGARHIAITPLIGSLNHFVSCQSEPGMRQEDTGDDRRWDTGDSPAEPGKAQRLCWCCLAGEQGLRTQCLSVISNGFLGDGWRCQGPGAVSSLMQLGKAGL